MAAQEIQIRPTHQLAAQVPETVTGPSSTDTDGFQDSLLSAVVRKHWWLLILFAVASTATGVVAAKYFGKQSAVTRGALIHSGLPIPPGPEVYVPPRMKTYEELLLSFSTLEQLREQRNIEIPAATLSEMIVCRSSRDSNLLNIELSWPNADTAVDTLNDLMAIFVNVVAQQRKRVLQDHMKHVEEALLDVRNTVDAAKYNLNIVREKRNLVLEESGLDDGRFARLMTQISNGQSSIDLKEAEQQGKLDQLQRIDEILSSRERELKSAWMHNVVYELENTKRQYSPQSSAWKQLDELERQVQALKDVDAAELGGFVSWRSRLMKIVSSGDIMVDENELAAHEKLLDEVENLSRTRQALEFDLMPLKNQIAILRRRQQEYQAEIDDLSNALTGVTGELVAEHEKALVEAEVQESLLLQQLKNMQQLEACRVAELTISLPASEATTRVGSNSKKMFAAAFLATGLLLSLPLFVSEWVDRRESPVKVAARRWGVPLIADRFLTHFSGPKPRLPDKYRQPGSHVWEELRLLALRIQQSARRPGSVIVFASSNASLSPVPLVSAVAECLRDREEKVLLIDAHDPVKSSLKILGRMPRLAAGNGAATGPGQGQELNQEGLAEYLSGELEGAENGLIRRSEKTNIDIIPSGVSAFPSEAFASSRLTDLLERCREDYTMILVNSPPTTAAADVQMWAARADVMVLLMDPKAARDREHFLAVRELIELRAPLIGVVG